jgi:fructose/tagatose bisphosphate aldolase
VERLEELHAAVPIPMVIHGCSGLKDDEYRKAYERGAKKFNIGTRLVQAFVKGLMEQIEARSINPMENAGQILRCLAAGKDAVYEDSKGRIQILNAANRF